MSTIDQFENVMELERGRQSQDPYFARTLSTIDDLKRKGILNPTRYKLPLTDTIGRQFSQARTSQTENR